MVKKESEIKAIGRNVRVVVGGFKLVESILSKAEIKDQLIQYEEAPLTSEFLKTELQAYFSDKGMEMPEGMIVASGRHSAEPHHEGKGVIKPNSLIVVDLFPKSKKNGLWADVSRTYIKGKPTATQKNMYEAVAAAGRASLAQLRPGITASALYRVSASVLKEHGFPVASWTKGAFGYLHALGHGLGKHIHEAPVLKQTDKTIIKPGMVLTIEPGVYDPKLGGVRLEDTVVVTKSGYKNLTNHHYRFVF